MSEVWVAAVVGGVATVGGAVISGNAAKSAAAAQANSQQSAIDAQMSMFNTTQSNFAPQVQLGQGAANMLGGIYGIGGVSGVPGSSTPTNGSPQPNYAAFYNSPGYQFALSQGQAQVNKQAAAGGNLYSSNTLAALGANQQGIASQQYNSYINQLLTMAGLGNAASSGVGSAATATGQGVANSFGNIGNANANGILGQSNAFSNALGSISNSVTNPNSPYGNLLGQYNTGIVNPDNLPINTGPTTVDMGGGYSPVIIPGQ